MKLAHVVLLALVAMVAADTYDLRRGHNNKNRYDVTDGQNTDNQKRIMDSELNAKGGFPPCNTPPTYPVGSVFTFAYTVQHGLSMQNLRSAVVLQYISSKDAPALMVYDAAGTDKNTLDFDGVFTNAGRTQITGGAANSNTLTRTQLEAAVPLNYVRGDQSTRGRRENARTAVEGFHRLRNGGTWVGGTKQVNEIADQPYQTATRQNTDGDDDRYGIELAAERDEYPHPHCSDFKDLAVYVGDATNVTTMCPFYQANSQNVQKRSGCDKVAYPTEQSCKDNGGNWGTLDCDWGIEPPVCLLAARSADNHLGNAQGDNSGGNNQVTLLHNITTPNEPGARIALRLRYNTSSGDFEGWGPNKLDHKHNGANAPFQQNQKYTIGTYANTPIELQMSINLAQFYRVFEDSSDHLDIAEDDGNACPGGTVFNIYSRGKRGNIVQAYPAVEYMPLPRQPEIDLCDCLNFQFTGAGPNDYKAGQNLYDAGQAGNGDQVDLHGAVCAANDGVNQPLYMRDWAPCVPEDVQNRDKVMWNMATSCVDEGTTVDVELDGSKLYCNVGTFQYCERTTLAMFSPRNNAFTNRSEKISIHVGNSNQLWIIAIAIASTLLVLSALSAGAALYAKKKPNSMVARMFQSNGNRGSGIMNSPRYK